MTRRARVKGIRVAALSNSWGTGDYDPYAGFVDDTEHNLPGARDLGMGTLFFTGADSEVAEIEKLIGIA